MLKQFKNKNKVKMLYNLRDILIAILEVYIIYVITAVIS
jgi:hypothetical protein